VREPSGISSRVFIDTSALFAVIDTHDATHARAVAITKFERRRMFTTNFVIAETHALLLRRLGRSVAALFLTATDTGTTSVIRVDEADELRAREIIALHDEKDYSLTDAMSFAVMERLHIDAAFTFDRHFAQYGFGVLGAEGA